MSWLMVGKVAFYSKSERPPNTVYIDAGVSVFSAKTLSACFSRKTQ